MQADNAGIGKPAAKPLLKLRCQADLRHQNQCLTTFAQALGDQPQIDFGLAAAGNAMQQKYSKVFPAGLNLCNCLLLFACRCMQIDESLTRRFALLPGLDHSKFQQRIGGDEEPR